MKYYMYTVVINCQFASSNDIWYIFPSLLLNLGHKHQNKIKKEHHQFTTQAHTLVSLIWKSNGFIQECIKKCCLQ